MHEFRPAKSIEETAKVLKCTCYQVKRVLKLAEKGGPNALATARQGSGRPRKDLGLTKSQREWILRWGTLRD